MQKTLLIKVCIILLLAAILSIPLNMVRSLVYERMARQEEVIANIASSYAEPQRITNPVLVLPYTEEYTLQDKRQIFRSFIYILPSDVDATGNIKTDVKRRGLFSAPIYTLDSNWKGHFEIPSDIEAPRYGDNIKVTWGQPYISVAVTDPRGFIGSPRITVNGNTTTISQGSGISALPGGIHTNIENFVPGQKRLLDFDLS